MSNIWMWVYAAGMVVAGILGGLGVQIEIVNWLLILARFWWGCSCSTSKMLGSSACGSWSCSSPRRA
jgi:hypothetical protein